MVQWFLMAALALACIVLAVLRLRDRHRIRILTGQMERFASGGQPALDVALEEDDLARAQNAAAELEEELLRARDQVKLECRRTDRLTADISHQLKTPLTTLRLYTEMDTPPHMEPMLEQITRMETLIHSLLRLERLCADGYEFTFAPAEVGELVREQWALLKPAFPGRELEITGGAVIPCDRKWLGEAYLNLLKNACQHTAPGGKITVTLERTDSAFFSTVSDNGGGVAPASLPRLFDRFFREQGSESQGAGIGLAIVKEIVRRHHGSVTAANTDTGLALGISLPLPDRELASAC